MASQMSSQVQEGASSFDKDLFGSLSKSLQKCYNAYNSYVAEGEAS